MSTCLQMTLRNKQNVMLEDEHVHTGDNKVLATQHGSCKCVYCSPNLKDESFIEIYDIPIFLLIHTKKALLQHKQRLVSGTILNYLIKTICYLL